MWLVVACVLVPVVAIAAAALLWMRQRPAEPGSPRYRRGAQVPQDVTEQGDEGAR
ncbi:MAG: hypothetical protein ACRDTG_23935 [Pseudonocardiaceae bacterium]